MPIVLPRKLSISTCEYLMGQCTAISALRKLFVLQLNSPRKETSEAMDDFRVTPTNIPVPVLEQAMRGT
jgi:hypothetical protein